MAEAMQATQGGDGPRYRRVAAELQARIERGLYPMGELMPTEHALCEEFSVSRHTVRDALRLLIMQGLVTRRRGSGTEVIATAPPSVYTHAMRSVNELYEYASDTVLDLASTSPGVSAPAAAGIDGDPADWMGFEGLRLTRTGAPISFTRVWMRAEYAEIEPSLRERSLPIYELIDRRYGAKMREVEQEIAGEPLGPEAARALGRRGGEAAIRVIRRYLDEAGRPMIVSASWHPAETFSYVMRLRREEMEPRRRG